MVFPADSFVRQDICSRMLALTCLMSKQEVEGTMWPSFLNWWRRGETCQHRLAITRAKDAGFTGGTHDFLSGSPDFLSTCSQYSGLHCCDWSTWHIFDWQLSCHCRWFRCFKQLGQWTSELKRKIRKQWTAEWCSPISDDWLTIAASLVIWHHRKYTQYTTCCQTPEELNKTYQINKHYFAILWPQLDVSLNN